jgi:hypothetical protein
MAHRSQGNRVATQEAKLVNRASDRARTDRYLGELLRDVEREALLPTPRGRVEEDSLSETDRMVITMIDALKMLNRNK